MQFKISSPLIFHLFLNSSLCCCTNSSHFQIKNPGLYLRSNGYARVILCRKGVGAASRQCGHRLCGVYRMSGTLGGSGCTLNVQDKVLRASYLLCSFDELRFILTNAWFSRRTDQSKCAFGESGDITHSRYVRLQRREIHTFFIVIAALLIIAVVTLP